MKQASYLDNPSLIAILASASNEETILTPNRRLCAFLQTVFNQKQKKEHVLNFKTPSIFSLSVFIEMLFFNQLLSVEKNQPVLLTSIQTRALWEKIVQLIPSGDNLLDSSETAQLIEKAWKIKTQWDLDIIPPYSEEVIAFLTWEKVYQAECTKNNWVDFYVMISQLIDILTNLNLPIIWLPKRVQFIGFDEWTPQLISFEKALNKRNVLTQKKQITSNTAKVTRTHSLNSHEEMQCSVHWAKKTLEQTDKKPNVIAIIIPELSRFRKKIAKMMAAVFVSEEYNISSPVAIREYPLVNNILIILEILTSKRIPLTLISLFLRSAYLENSQEEAIIRASLDRQLYAQGQSDWTLQELIKFIENTTQNDFLLIEILKKLEIFSKRTLSRIKQTPIEWAQSICNILQMCGIKENKFFSITEHQLLAKWDSLLLEYGKLEFILNKQHYQSAFQTIVKLSYIMEFLPKEKDAPVQVLGILEATGIPFQAAFVVGLHQEVWPDKASPNPFLPINLQRVFNTPNASAKRELAVAKRFTTTLCQTISQELIFSSPEIETDRVLFPSQLILSYPEKCFQLTEQKDLSNDTNNREKTRLENYCEQPIPIILDHEKKPGGIKVLALQAACSFWAFSEIRLQAKSFRRIFVGLSLAERGEILHEILAQLPLERNLKKIEQTILKVLERWNQKKGHRLQTAYIKLEKKRLVILMNKWLLFEKKFIQNILQLKHVLKEQVRKLKLGELELTVRLDSINKLEDRRFVILDYKTGHPLMDCEGARPTNPQLPLYALANKSVPIGVIIAIIRADKIQLKGFFQGDCRLPGVKQVENMEKKVALWRSQLTNLSFQYIRGTASVDPKNQLLTCRYCALKSFCRVNVQKTSSLDFHC